MKTAAQTFSQPDQTCIRRLFSNPIYTEKIRMYQLSWYFDYRACNMSPDKAYEEVIKTLEVMQNPQDRGRAASQVVTLGRGGNVKEKQYVCIYLAIPSSRDRTQCSSLTFDTGLWAQYAIAEVQGKLLTTKQWELIRQLERKLDKR